MKPLEVLQNGSFLTYAKSGVGKVTYMYVQRIPFPYFNGLMLTC